MTSKQILEALKSVAREDKAEFLPGFFQVHEGGYGEGDQFLGCVVPDQRKIAKRFGDLPRAELVKLLQSPWHECRLTGMFILVAQFQQAARAKNPSRETDQREIVDFYLASLYAVNNWDLVDGTAPKILGAWLLENPEQRSDLRQMAESESIWVRRVAILATMPLIQAGQFDEIVALAEQRMGDHHDLMHKAIGWMLREMGKRNPAALNQFLTRHAAEMPRTMLRYAIEKMTKSERSHWMHHSA